MTMSATATAAAGVEQVWSALVDVTSWPRWTASIHAIELLDEGPLAVGSRARIKQPGTPDLVWVVEELHEPDGVTWTTRSAGVRTVGRHTLQANPDGTTQIVLEVEHSGPLAGVVEALTGRRTRRYLQLEAAGLKAAGEDPT